MDAGRQAGRVTAPGKGRPWTARLAAADTSSAAALRLLPGVEAAESADDPPTLWLRGPERTDEVIAALRRVPGIEQFLLLPGDLLASPGARVPSKRLPALVWRPIATTFALALPQALTAGDLPASVAIRVVPSVFERPAAALLTDVAAWEAWCIAAAGVRLQRLRFAACTDGRVLVRGEPLPPIARAVLLWEDDGVLVPCGLAPSPDVGGEVLRTVFGLAEGDVAVLGAGASFEVVSAAQFAPASRSAARLTRSGLAGR